MKRRYDPLNFRARAIAIQVIIGSTVAGFGVCASCAAGAGEITVAAIAAGRLYVLGTTSEPHQHVVLDGRFDTVSNDARTFQFALVYHPASCIVGVSVGTEKYEAVVSSCAQTTGEPVSNTADGHGNSRLDEDRAGMAPSAPVPATADRLPSPPLPAQAAIPPAAVVVPEPPLTSSLPAPTPAVSDRDPSDGIAQAAAPDTAARVLTRVPRPPMRPPASKLARKGARHDASSQHSRKLLARATTETMERTHGRDQRLRSPRRNSTRGMPYDEREAVEPNW